MTSRKKSGGLLWASHSYPKQMLKVTNYIKPVYIIINVDAVIAWHDDHASESMKS